MVIQSYFAPLVFEVLSPGLSYSQANLRVTANNPEFFNILFRNYLPLHVKRDCGEWNVTCASINL